MPCRIFDVGHPTERITFQCTRGEHLTKEYDMKNLAMFACAIMIAAPAIAAPARLHVPGSLTVVQTNDIVAVDWKQTAKDKGKKAKDYAKDKGKKALKFGAKSSKATLPGRVAVGLLYPKTACAPSNANDC